MLSAVWKVAPGSRCLHPPVRGVSFACRGCRSGPLPGGEGTEHPASCTPGRPEAQERKGCFCHHSGLLGGGGGGAGRAHEYKGHSRALSAQRAQPFSATAQLTAGALRPRLAGWLPADRAPMLFLHGWIRRSLRRGVSVSVTLKLALPGVLAALTGLCQQAWQWCLLGLCASAVSPGGSRGLPRPPVSPAAAVTQPSGSRGEVGGGYGRGRPHPQERERG